MQYPEADTIQRTMEQNAVLSETFAQWIAKRILLFFSPSPTVPADL